MFTAQDTYRGDGIDTSNWDLYAYCDGDPVNATDPTGHKKKPIYDISNRLDNAMKTHLKWLLKKWIKANKSWCSVKRVKRMYKLYKKFYSLVKTEGKWDLKYQWNTKTTAFWKQIVYHGEKIEQDDPGNIHFGYVGCVLFPEEALVFGAGIYQIKTDYSTLNDIIKKVKQFKKKGKKKAIFLKRLKSYGDDPKDSKFIRKGYRLGMGYKKALIDKWIKKDMVNSSIRSII